MYDKKLAEFNFKILHNIVPSGYVISKWEKSVSPKCLFCGINETTEHMLFSCERISVMWQNISKILNINITWKVLVCGFIQRHTSQKVDFINMMLAIILYSVFKQNSRSKFENKNYKDMNVVQNVKLDLCYRKCILECTKYGIYSTKMYDDIVNSL